MHHSPFSHRAGARLAAAWVLRVSLIVVLMFHPVRACPGSPGGTGARPLLVGKISIDQQNVFDDNDSTLLRVVGSVANSVHVLTSKEVIRREMLLREGDPYDQRGVALGRNLCFTKAGRADYFIKVFGQRSLAFGEKLFASYQAEATSYLDRWVVQETTVSGIALHHWRISENHNVTGRVAAAIGSRWIPSSKMVLGGSTGLRGYRNYAFFGHRMLLINFEHRLMSLVRVWFLKLGGVMFFDSGAMWDQDEDLSRQRFHSSAGLGLRFNVMGGVFRLDAAYNFDRQAISFGVSANQIFRVFAPLEFAPPVPGQPLR